MGDGFQLVEVSRPLGCDSDGLASTIGWIRHPVDVMGALEASDDFVDVVAVKPKTSPDIGLAQRPELLKGSENGEIGSTTERHPARRQAGPEGGDLSGLPLRKGFEAAGRP